LAESANLPVEKIREAFKRLCRWKYISFALAPRGRRQCIYKISAKGSLWLNKWGFLIPWERYGWTEETIAEIDRKIKEIVDFRGYK
jgi:DNA-binding PadR family transcriptional regulator